MGKSTISMAIFNSYVKLPGGKPPFSYGFPMVFLWFVVFNTVAVAVHGWFPVLCWKSPKNDEGFLR